MNPIRPRTLRSDQTNVLSSDTIVQQGFLLDLKVLCAWFSYQEKINTGHRPLSQPLQAISIKLFLFLWKLKRKSLTNGTQLQGFFFSPSTVFLFSSGFANTLGSLFSRSFKLSMEHFPSITKPVVHLIWDYQRRYHVVTLVSFIFLYQ